MTLLVCVGNQDYCYLASDRRLTAGEHVAYENSSKSVAFFCDDARCALAFTGVALLDGDATAPAFDTQYWLVDTLSLFGKTSSQLTDALLNLQHAANRDLPAVLARVPPKQRALTVVVFGYRYWAGPPELFHSVLTNVDPATGVAAATFTWIHHAQPDGRVWLYGDDRCVSDDAMKVLHDSVRAPHKPKTAATRAAALIRRAASHPRNRGLIGQHCNVLVVPSAVNTAIGIGCFSRTASAVSLLPGCVITAEGGAVCCLGQRVQQFGSPNTGPELKNKAPCWCGSGKQYRLCHKKHGGSVPLRCDDAGKPMVPVFGIGSANTLPSGSRWFVVASLD